MEVLAREEGWFKRKVREAIEIKTRQPTINIVQEFDLPDIYREIGPYYRCHVTAIVRPAVTRSCDRGSRYSQPDEVGVT